MAGHSHAANVKHRKDAQNKKRVKIYTKILRLIYVAAKNGSNPEHNPSLRLALDKARFHSLPKDKVNATIVRASSPAAAGENYEDVRYDGYIKNIAFVIECTTDNRNRTASVVRSSFTKFGGNLSETGSLDFMFSRVGVIYAPTALNYDAVFENCLDALDILENEDAYEIITSFEDFHKLSKSYKTHFGDPVDEGLEYRASDLIPVDEEQKQSILKFIDILEESDDVSNIWHNASF